MSENQNTCCETWENKSCVKCDTMPYIIIIVLLMIISVLSFFVGKNYDVIFHPKMKNENINGVKDQNINNSWSAVTSDIVIKIIWDKRCPECPTPAITEQLKKLPFLAGAQFEMVDFSDEWVKEILKANDVKTLPAFLLNTKNVPDSEFAKYLVETPAGLFSLNVWSEFDPFGEMCNNQIDDNGDNLVDCADPTCAKDFTCAPKVDRPVADLYIMSYCPYGLQAQKWYLEVMSKLWKVADVNIKFVQYVMHDQKEADENVVQYCIQKNEKDKYTKYLNCYLAEADKWAACRKEVKIDEKKLTSCIDTTKKEFKVDEKMKDTSKQYPDFDINKTEALAAGVQWSPTFVLNGIKLDKIGRNAKAFADAICSSFKNKPKDCEQTFQDINFDPSFWFTTGNGANTANSWCGQ